MEWITENWGWLSIGVFIAATIAGFVVSKTANSTDDEWWAMIESLLIRFGFLRRKEDGSLGIGVPLLQGDKKDS